MAYIRPLGTDERQQKYREEILSTTVADFHRTADVVQRMKDVGVVVIMGSAEAIEKVKAAKPGFLVDVKSLS